MTRKEGRSPTSCEDKISRVRRIEFLRKTSRRKERSSYKGLTENALVRGAEEGRDKLRKAAGRSKYLTIRRYPNEGTQHDKLVLSFTE